jgi:thiol-disulfide isomerase/thioredoxin
LINLKYNILLALEKHEEALETFEKIIERRGDSPDIMADKIRLLFMLERYDEALATALDVDQKSEGQSPFVSFFIFRTYLAQNNKEMAYEWLEKSVDRDFEAYEFLLQDEFKALHNEKRFKDLISKMKEKTGIGKPAKGFSGPLLSGEAYSLFQSRGKVVLIDFWATWCPPCVAALPKLKELYEELHPKGFEILGVSLDSDRQTIDKFLSKRDIPWKILYSGEGMDDAAAKLYRINSVPKYFLVDKKGILRVASDTGGKALAAAVRELVRE